MQHTSKNAATEAAKPQAKWRRPRTLKKTDLEQIFDCNRYRLNKFFLTPDFREELGITPKDYQAMQEFNVAQTEKIIERFQIQDEELIKLSNPA